MTIYTPGVFRKAGQNGHYHAILRHSSLEPMGQLTLCGCLLFSHATTRPRRPQVHRGFFVFFV